MRVRADSATSNRDIAVPRPVSRQKSYRSGRSDQASTSSGKICCASLTCIEDRIEEESEDSEMVLGGPTDRSAAQAGTSEVRSNGNVWVPERDDYESDKDEDDEVTDEPVAQEIGPQLPAIFDEGFSHDNIMPAAGIIVTVSPYEDDVPTCNNPSTSSTNSDNKLLMELRVREYRVNFDGFAMINRFETIDEMHDFIVKNAEPVTNVTSPEQKRYLEILLNERPENRFRSLLETSKNTVRRILESNEHIMSTIYESASLKNFPNPLAPKTIDWKNDEDDDDDNAEDAEDAGTNENIAEVEENMKRWYMIEMIGKWLKFVTDAKSYREAIKRCVLKTSCGIENDRYEGIAVPLRYK